MGLRDRYLPGDWRENKCLGKFDFSGKGIDLHDPKDILIGNYDWGYLCWVSPSVCSSHLAVIASHPARDVRCLLRIATGHTITSVSSLLACASLSCDLGLSRAVRDQCWATAAALGLVEDQMPANQ